MERTTMQIVRHHCEVLAKGDIAATVSDYTEDAYIFTPAGIVRGHKEIAAFFIDSVENCLPPDTVQEFISQTYEGELGQIVWKAESRFVSIPFGTDTFVVRGGKIVMQTFAGIINPKAGGGA